MSNKGKVFLGIGLLALLSAFVVYFYCQRGSNDVDLSWMQQEFKLTDTQFGRIAELHRAYQLKCEEHCLNILRFRNTVKEIESTAEPDATALHAAKEQLARYTLVCEEAIHTHIQQVASLMPEDEGPRYLAFVRSHLKNFDHAAPPALHTHH